MIGTWRFNEFKTMQRAGTSNFRKPNKASTANNAERQQLNSAVERLTKPDNCVFQIREKGLFVSSEKTYYYEVKQENASFIVLKLTDGESPDTSKLTLSFIDDDTLTVKFHPGPMKLKLVFDRIRNVGKSGKRVYSDRQNDRMKKPFEFDE